MSSMATKTCSIRLVNGPNKGKLCCESDTRCRHGNYKCDGCGSVYLYSYTLADHLKTCKVYASKLGTKSKPSILPKRTGPDTNELIAQLCAQMQAMNDKIQSLQGAVMPHGVAGAPGVHVGGNVNVQNIQNIQNIQNNIQNIQIQNIVVIDPDFYGALVRKMGVRGTHACLERAAMGQQLDVVRALYLNDRSPKEWPIARQGARHYRYLDGNRNIVDDPDGRKLAKLLGDSIMNAFLAASSALISEGLTDSAPPALIEQYHHIQAFDHRKLSDPDYVLTGLDSLIPTTDCHPFFTVASTTPI